MYTIEDCQELGINFPGGFEFSFTQNGQAKIDQVWDAEGNKIVPAREELAILLAYANGCLEAFQDMASEAILANENDW